MISMLLCNFFLRLYRMLEASLYFKHEKAISTAKATERDKKIMYIRERNKA